MNYLNMSAFNAQFVDNSSVEFVTLTEVTLPGQVPRGMIYKSELCTAVFTFFNYSSASDEEIKWYRHTISPNIDKDNKEHTIKVFVNTLCVFKPSHTLFKWILGLTEILDDYVPKYRFCVRIESKSYSSITGDGYSGDYLIMGTMNKIIRHTIDSMYAHNIITTFNITTKNAFMCPPSYRSCWHGGCGYLRSESGPDKCFWCYLKENGEIPYGIYLFDKQQITQNGGYSHSSSYYCLECVIYDINPEVIDWFINLERFFHLKIIYFTPLNSYHNTSGARSLTYYPLLNQHAYLTPERLSLLIKLMKEDSHLLDKIYGTFSCKLVSETIIDVPPSDKSSIETQTEPPKGLLSRIFGL